MGWEEISLNERVTDSGRWKGEEKPFDRMQAECAAGTY